MLNEVAACCWMKRACLYFPSTSFNTVQHLMLNCLFSTFAMAWYTSTFVEQESYNLLINKRWTVCHWLWRRLGKRNLVKSDLFVSSYHSAYLRLAVQLWFSCFWCLRVCVFSRREWGSHGFGWTRSIAEKESGRDATGSGRTERLEECEESESVRWTPTWRRRWHYRPLTSTP